MTIDSSPNLYDEHPESSATTITCSTCLTAREITIDSIESIEPRLMGRVSLAYSCSTCQTSFAHDSTALDVAQFLGNQADPLPVAHLGGHYIHCGEPMQEGPLQLTAVKVDDDDLANVPAVEIESTVLRCQCGFQMSVPVASTI